MPPQKPFSKNDTWTTEQLERSLKGSKYDHHKHGDEKKKEHFRKPHREDASGEERERRTNDEESNAHRSRHQTNRQDDTHEKRKEVEGDLRQAKHKSEDGRRKDEKRSKKRDDSSDVRRKKEIKDKDGEERRRPQEERLKKEEATGRDARQKEKKQNSEDGEEQRRHREGRAKKEESELGVRWKEENDEERKRRHREEKKMRRKEIWDDVKKKAYMTPDREREKKKKERNLKEEFSDEERERLRRERRDKQKKEEKKVLEEKILHKSTERNKKSLIAAEDIEDGDYNYEDDFEDYEDDFEDEDDEKDEKPKLTSSQQEIDDVLQAMNRENELVLRRSQVSSDSVPSSAESGRAREGSEENQKKRPVKSVINFVSAKQRELSRKATSKVYIRSKDLQKIIELELVSYELFELPPVSEYEMYIRSFGRADTKQVYVQTGDDSVDRDVQTGEIEQKEKWTQHPADGHFACGGNADLTVNADSYSFQVQLDTMQLNTFLQQAAHLMTALLEEDLAERQQADSGKTSSMSFSQSFCSLAAPSFLQERCVTYSYFSPTHTDFLLTAYSPSLQVMNSKKVHKSTRGVICVWNVKEPSNPQKVLACEAEPTCCCFGSPKPSLVFAGCADGSVIVWDLRESIQFHETSEDNYTLRLPTYTTAGVLGSENHQSPVTTILPLVAQNENFIQDRSSLSDFGSGLSFQMVSLEQNGILNMWVVAEVKNSDPSGSETDLGLAPGGKVKLLKSSSVVLDSPIRDPNFKTPIQAYELQLYPNDPNHIYVATDTTFVIHDVRLGAQPYPRAHFPDKNGFLGVVAEVTSLDISPFSLPCFLCGHSDGSIHLYHTSLESALVSWPSTVTGGNAVLSVRWSRSRPCIFYVVDVVSQLYVFDLMECDREPIAREKPVEGRIVSVSYSTGSTMNSPLSTVSLPQMLIGFDSGKTELHTIAEKYWKQQPFEQEFMKYLLDSL